MHVCSFPSIAPHNKYLTPSVLNHPNCSLTSKITQLWGEIETCTHSATVVLAPQSGGEERGGYGVVSVFGGVEEVQGGKCVGSKAFT